MGDIIKHCNCGRTAIFICECTPVYSCQRHLFAHLKQNIPHRLTKITDYFLIQKQEILEIIEKKIKKIQSTQDELSEILQKLINYASKTLNDLKISLNIHQEKLLELKNSLFFHPSLHQETTSIRKQVKNFESSLMKNLLEFTENYLKTIKDKVKTFTKEKKENIQKTSANEYISDEISPMDQWKVSFFVDNIGKITSISLSKSENFFAFGSEDSTVRVFNVPQKRMECILFGHLGRVLCVEMTNSEKLVISGSDDKTIRVWDFASKKTLKILENNNQKVKWLSLSDDDKYLVSSGANNKAFVWKLSENKIISNLDYISGFIKPLFDSPSTFVYAYEKSLKMNSILKLSFKSFLYSHHISCFTLCNERKNALIVFRCLDLIIEVVLRTFTQIRQISINSHKFQGNLLSFGYVPKLDFLYLSDNIKEFQLIFDKSKESKLMILTKEHTSLYPSSLSSIFYFSLENSIGFYKIPEDEIEVLISFSYFDAVVSITSHDNNLFLFTSFQNRISVFNIELGTVTCELPDFCCKVSNLAISKSNSYIISTHICGKIKVWNLGNVSLVSTFALKSKKFTCICFSQQEKLFAFSSNDKTVTLLGLQDSLQISKFEICLTTVKSLSFSHDDTFLLIGEENGCVRGFRLCDMVQIFLLCGAKKGAMLVRVSDNGNVVIVGDGQGTVRVWDRSQAKVVDNVRGINESLKWSQKYLEFKTDFEKFYKGRRKD